MNKTKTKEIYIPSCDFCDALMSQYAKGHKYGIGTIYICNECKKISVEGMK